MRYFTKKKVGVATMILAFAGVTLLIGAYLYTFLGPDQLQLYSLRFLAVLTLFSFFAMAGASLGRFEPEASQLEVRR